MDNRLTYSIWHCLRGNKKYSSWQKLVGYTLDELYIHLESTFEPWMTWELYMEGKIVIDHILPKSLFEYSSHEDEQFKICWGLKNLRMLDYHHNNCKTDRLSDGRNARSLSKQQKLEFLINNGIINT